MARRIVLAVVAAGMLGGSRTTVASGQAAPPTHPAASAALRYLESVEDSDFDAFLRQLRRPAPSPVFRAIEIARLPEEGALTPTADEAAKLAAVRPLLAFHGREHDIELRLFTEDGAAFVGFHARTVLLISREALDLFTTDEVLAIMAHELGHDYFWDVFEEALQLGDQRLLQELELRCDAIALIAMGRLGVDAEYLVSALTKLARYGERGRKTPNEARYVPMDERVRFIRTVAGRIARVFESHARNSDRVPVAGPRQALCDVIGSAARCGAILR